MTLERINITIGTAGHIDHGKTALVKLLTGCDTDRLKAEKERGMSIDLGFAPCKIADTEIGIVDVPGHEAFIKTMVAGAGGMDGVVLVVAADDGVMPQTREHLEILTLLGVKHGFVAMTKIDRVDADHVELAKAETEDFLRGTFLEEAPICPLSSITGEGFDAFYTELIALTERVSPRRLDGVFRVPLDRAFSVQGYGTVVAGIPLSGSARVGDEVILLPQGTPGRIRRIQVYGRDSDQVMAGQCAAINVSHWDPKAITRGDVITTPDFFTAGQWFACKLRMLRRDKLSLKAGAQIKFHTGTSEANAAIYPMQGERINSGDECLVQIRSHAPVIVGPGDHFLIRTLSPVRTAGGGIVIETLPGRMRRNRPGAMERLQQQAEAVGEERTFVEHCIKTARSLAIGKTDIAHRAKVPAHRLDKMLRKLEKAKRVVTVAAEQYMHVETIDTASSALVEYVAEYHRRSPESPGIPPDELRTERRLERPAFDHLVRTLQEQDRLEDRKRRLALPSHEVVFDAADDTQLNEVEELFRRNQFAPPKVEEIVDTTDKDRKTIERILKLLVDHQRLVRVESTLYFHAEAIDRAKQLLTEEIRKEGQMESVRFKYLLDTTRKFAIPLLDHFDRIGVTRRSGHTRFLREK